MALRAWMASSLVRHYPATPAPKAAPPVRLDLALNDSGSCQVVIRHDASFDTMPVKIAVEAEGDGLDVRVRRVGYVPMRHRSPHTPDSDAEGMGFIPGFVPDPLFEENELPLPGGETHAFWLTVRAKRNARPGPTRVVATITPEKGRAMRVQAKVVIHDVRVAPRKNFPILSWFYCDSLFDLHHTNGYDERFWEIFPNYVANIKSHHHDNVYTPVFTPPLDGVRKPSQLLRIKKEGRGRYAFDWTDVKRYVDVVRRYGLGFEWTHLFWQWGAAKALRIYENQGREGKLLWSPEESATGPVYKNFLAQFLPAFHRFLTREKILNKSFFHVSDEPHGADHVENYRRARALLAELAPWMHTSDALSDIVYGRQKIVETPIVSTGTALDFVKENIPCWVYYCCGPQGRFPNRLLDTPLAKIRIQGWLWYRWPFGGFLHWGYNYWYHNDPVVKTMEAINPYYEQGAMCWPSWASGDPFVVYPGKDGPVDSLRWEVFAEGLADYALLQTANTPRDGRLLSPIKTLEDFPRDAAWLEKSRRALLGRG